MSAKDDIEDKLEKLGRAIGSDDSIVKNVMSRIETRSLAGLQTGRAQDIWRIIMKNRITKLAAVVVIVAATLGILVLTSSDNDVGSKGIVAGESLHAEIIRIKQMAATHDVEGLASMLSQGRFESKLLAANFLAKMGDLPALEALAMHASGNLILENQAGTLVLGSADSPDWLEVSGDTLLLHTDQTVQTATEIRMTQDVLVKTKDWEDLQAEFSRLHQESAALEETLNQQIQALPEDTQQLRERLAKMNEFLDEVEGAVYITVDGSRLIMDCPLYECQASAELANGIVRVESQGTVVEANSVTLLHSLRPVRTDGPPAPTADWRERFEQVYSLNDDEVLRWVRPPFIPERQIYTTQEMQYYASDNPPPPGYVHFRWNGELYNWGVDMSQCELVSLLIMMRLKRYEYSDPSEKLLRLKLGGDWIERDNVPIEDKFSALEEILQNELGREIRFEKRQVHYDNAIIVRGQFKHVPLEGVDRPENIYLYTNLPEHFRGPEPFGSGGTGSVARMIEWVGSDFNRPVVFETQDLSDATVSWCDSESLGFATAEAKTKKELQAILDSVLQNLSRQTSLQFEYGQHDKDVWFITE